MAPAARGLDLDLPEHDFTYEAASTDRPWHQFTGRWRAMKPRLASALGAMGKDRPLRVVDLGSCTGFFALQAAHAHPEADIVGVEGSVGIGNGTEGVEGTVTQILKTGAVRTHLRWIRRLGLPNCFVAPEVWDYVHICKLVAHGRPICDAMFNLSVIHHIHGVSVNQYAAAGLSRLDGFVDLAGKLLRLAPNHFVELPNRPWIQEAYDHYGSSRNILEAAAKASGREWQFTGPLYVAEWFGRRELWLLEARTPMPPLDIQMCPFPQLFRDDEPEDAARGRGEPEASGDDAALGAFGDDIEWARMASDMTAGPGPAGFTVPGNSGRTIDPGLMLLTDPFHAVDESVGVALSSASTELLIAHLTLREAVGEANEALREAREAAARSAPSGADRRGAAMVTRAAAALGAEAPRLAGRA